MEKKNVLFYDYNSYDANLAQYINKMIFGFESVPVVVPTNTTDSDTYFDPPTIYQDAMNDVGQMENAYNNLIFVGVKPTKIFCDLAKETRITVFDDGAIEQDYYLYCPNVFIVAKGSFKTLTKSFVEYFQLYYHQQSKCNKTKIAGDLFDLASAFESYSKHYQSDNLLDVYLDSYVKAITFKETNDYIDFENFEEVFDRINTKPISKSGEFNRELLTQKTNRIIQKSSAKVYTYTNTNSETITYNVIRIQADETTIRYIDKFLVAFYKSTGVNLFDFVEYYSINPDETVKVVIKNNTTIVSPVEIKKYEQIVEYIGQSNFDTLIDYIDRRYEDVVRTVNYNGTLTFNCDNQLYFIQ